jgi:hypothetical protein
MNMEGWSQDSWGNSPLDGWSMGSCSRKGMLVESAALKPWSMQLYQRGGCHDSLL